MAPPQACRWRWAHFSRDTRTVRARNRRCQGEGCQRGAAGSDLVSYLPEAIGSSADMKAGLERPRMIVVLSLVVAAVCALAWVVTRVLPCDGRAVRGAVDGFAAPVSWTVTLEITGWVVVVAGHLGLKGAVLKAVRCRAPRRPGLNSVR